MNLELVVRQGELPGHIFRLRQGEQKTLGRAPECDIYMPDQGVSRSHCTIENLGQKLEIVDLDSANGSCINGKIVKKGTLRPGDQLTVGPSVLECRISAVAHHASPSHEPALAYREEDGMTIVRKVVDTQFPGVDVVAAAQPGELKNLMRAQRNLAAAYQISKVLSTAQDIDGLFEEVIDSVFAAVNADRAALILRDGGNDNDLKVVSARARSHRHAHEEITVSRTVVRDVLEHGVSSLSRDAAADERYREGDSIISQKIRSVLCAPVSTDDSVLGVLYADSRSMTGAFSESDLELLALIGNQAGVAIHRAQLIAQIERFFFETIRAIVATIDAKDGYTHRHSERVAAFAERMAHELGVSDDGIEAAKLSALLHDVGKIGVPESILNKPGRLTVAEFDEMKKHPVHGFKILTHIKIPRFQAILPGVRNHHERWDGSGYPDGLVGANIPFLGRLLAVADVLDALNSKRSYREGLGFDKTVEYIKSSAGSHFDPEIAAAAVKLHTRGELEVPADWIEPGSDADPLETLEG
jgi:putative nucleotidyltransferase with HDIG domain